MLKFGSQLPLPLQDLLLLYFVRIVLEDRLEYHNHRRVKGAALRLQDELNVSQRGDDHDLAAAVAVVLDALYREFQHVGQDLRHGGVLIVGEEYLLAEGEGLRLLAAAELGHAEERLQFVAQLRFGAHRLRAHQLNNGTTRE